jgi:hypothetical protein
MDSEDWHWYGLTVRTRDGTVVGVVVGVFAEGLLAGRLRVQGHYRHRCTAWTETAVYAIPRSAVWGRYQDVTVVRAPALLAGGVRLFPLTRDMRTLVASTPPRSCYPWACYWRGWCGVGTAARMADPRLGSSPPRKPG